MIGTQYDAPEHSSLSALHPKEYRQMPIFFRKGRRWMYSKKTSAFPVP